MVVSSTSSSCTVALATLPPTQESVIFLYGHFLYSHFYTFDFYTGHFFIRSFFMTLYSSSFIKAFVNHEQR